ncbi:MAG: helix-turn-helix transcriptional regulator [Clostridia bacterium]|nr:helix-turn-helix transcriptional regulator [Clostridia bacterium]
MLHDNLRYARLRCGLTQKDVAESLDIKRSSYTYYETGHTPLPIELLPTLCCLYGVTMDWMMTSTLVFEADDCSLPSWANHELPGIGNLTTEERKVFLAMRKYDLSTKVEAYIQTLVEEIEKK